MAIYNGDQQANAGSIMVNGSLVLASVGVLKAVSPAASCYTFTADFQFIWRGQHAHYKRTATYSLSADIKAALLASGAPMVAA